MKLFITFYFAIISVVLIAQETKMSVKELNNFGYDYVGNKIKIKAEFNGLDQDWVAYLPWVKGGWKSPEGLEHSFLPKEASKWLGFMIKDINSWDLYHLCFAPKDKFKDLLMNLKESRKRVKGDIIEITGTVFDFRTNMWAGLLVEKIVVISSKQKETNNIPQKNQNVYDTIIKEKYTNNYLKQLQRNKSNLTNIIISLTIGFFIGGISGFLLGRNYK